MVLFKMITIDFLLEVTEIRFRNTSPNYIIG